MVLLSVQGDGGQSSCDTFIEASVLPFTDESDTASFVPGLNVLQAPMHNIMLYSNLFQGQAAVGVRPALPMEGVNVLLGNGLVTCDTSASASMFSLSDFALSVSQDDLKVEQKADLSLQSLFEQVVTDSQIESSARGYFLRDGLLVRKWVLHGESFVDDPIAQIVAPEKFHESVFKGSS